MSAPSFSRGAPSTTAVVIDDTPDIRFLMRLALEMDGDIQVVAEAANGREGVEAVREHDPDVVLIDMAMPVMDGLEALPHIRRLSPAACVVMVSGFTCGSMARSAVDAGADAYLQKGACPTEILTQVREILRRGGPTR